MTYPNDDALITDVREWLAARLVEVHRAELGREERLRGLTNDAIPHTSETLAQRRAWVERLEHSQGLAVVQFARLLGLGSNDLLWVIVLLALDGDLGFHRMRRRWFNEDDFTVVGLIVRLVADNDGERVALLDCLDTRAPLLRHRLVGLTAPITRPGTGLRNQIIELDESVVAFCDRRDYWPPGIDNLVVLHPPNERPGQRFFATKLDRLDRAMSRRTEQPGGVFVALGGATLDTTRALALSWALRSDRPLLEVSAHWLLSEPSTFERAFRLIVREALLRNAIVFIDGARKWDDKGSGAAEILRAITRSARVYGRPLLFDAAVEGDPMLRRHLAPLYELRVLPPTLDEQVVIWQDALEHVSVTSLSEQTLRTQVCDMALNVEDIHRAARLAADNTWLMGAEGDGTTDVGADALKSMATSKLNQGMYAVAERVNTTLTWNDVILPEKVLGDLMEVITYARYQRQVFEDWGFGSKLPYGRANSSLFTGPPGTGKTMVAGIMARELGLDLFRVDLSSVVSKFVGETEKNLSKVFDEASRSHALILFDEADSLFAKRTEVKSSHDRYSNLEVNYLLQRIETFSGITILTSNFADNIDEAFARRIKFKIDFPFPEPDDRALLWRVMLPDMARSRDDLDFERLGRAFEISGGSIKNAMLKAAFKAAETDNDIDQIILEQAGIDECRQMGKLVRVDVNGRVLVSKKQGA